MSIFSTMLPLVLESAPSQRPLDASAAFSAPLVPGELVQATVLAVLDERRLLVLVKGVPLSAISLVEGLRAGQILSAKVEESGGRVLLRLDRGTGGTLDVTLPDQPGPDGIRAGRVTELLRTLLPADGSLSAGLDRLVASVRAAVRDGALPREALGRLDGLRERLVVPPRATGSRIREALVALGLQDERTLAAMVGQAESVSGAGQTLKGWLVEMLARRGAARDVPGTSLPRGLAGAPAGTAEPRPSEGASIPGEPVPGVGAQSGAGPIEPEPGRPITGLQTGSVQGSTVRLQGQQSAGPDVGGLSQTAQDIPVEDPDLDGLARLLETTVRQERPTSAVASQFELLQGRLAAATRGGGEADGSSAGPVPGSPAGGNPAEAARPGPGTEGKAPGGTGAALARPEIVAGERLAAAGQLGSLPESGSAQAVRWAGEPAWTREAEGLLRVIERAQVLNVLSQQAGQPLLFELPLGWDGGSFKFYLEEREPDRDRGTEEGRERPYRVVTLLELDGLGALRVNALLTGKRIAARFLTEHRGVEQALAGFLPTLHENLTAQGYQVESLASATADAATVRGRELQLQTLPRHSLVNVKA
ncbi:MAG: flagellar hook-length control protein FliK [Nitrospirota bacterium]